jgi:predicted nucleic acid-binding protein
LKYTLDADIVIGALDRTDPHHQAARRMFSQWHSQDDTILISVVNLSEVLIAPASDQQRLRRHGQRSPRSA